MRWVAFLVLVLTLAAGCVLEDKPVDPDFDGGVEAGTCIVCPATTPVCYDDTLCVECTADDERYCTQMAQVCKTDAFECADCNVSTECNDADAAHCNMETNKCEACEGDADCNGILGLPRCQAGTCVQCTPATEGADCGAKSCDPATFACTGTDVGSVETCEECVSDSECGEDGSSSEAHRCVEMFCPVEEMFCSPGDRFPDDETGFCLKVFALGGCEQPYAIRISDRESLSGDPLESYCGISETLATCLAVRALKENQECPGGEDSECPESGLCRDVGGLPDRCTYRCEIAQQCLPTGGDPDNPNPGSTCNSSGSGGDDYCGG
jgi:hypothetical protein